MANAYCPAAAANCHFEHHSIAMQLHATACIPDVNTSRERLSEMSQNTWPFEASNTFTTIVALPFEYNGSRHVRRRRRASGGSNGRVGFTFSPQNPTAALAHQGLNG